MAIKFQKMTWLNLVLCLSVEFVFGIKECFAAAQLRKALQC